eukprot:gnl/TRDRNA2_/TRDRNA2_157681_c0_seq3.p2 gnl/TRDRNA2_/TRDRNA2_157681_c0~~gnl/TRDRNA2_/TRDRNA2_157681_c0_seq3.p2  ORF type:complete len:176 (+),score=34.38 gnl/TRDRNA2_/TRDRNA2_157681_c0_seq3:164-691(+)
MRVFLCPAAGCDGHCVAMNDEKNDSLAQCAACCKAPTKKQVKELFRREAAFVEAVLQLDKSPFLVSSNPARIDDLLLEGTRLFAPRGHWAVARLHDIAVGFRRHSQDLAKAYEHMSCELQFWEEHIARPSQQAAWKRKMRADVAASLGHFDESFREYTRALMELQSLPLEDGHVY